MDARKHVGLMFWRFGFSTSLYGYYYAKEAVIYTIENGCFTNKDWLTWLADKYNTDKQNIERCIRTMIDKSWDKIQQTGIFENRPSCREFILRCAEYINLRMDGLCQHCMESKA